MPALICGSLAFDTITTFPGRFAQQILPVRRVDQKTVRVRRLRRIAGENKQRDDDCGEE